MAIPPLSSFSSVDPPPPEALYVPAELLLIPNIVAEKPVDGGGNVLGGGVMSLCVALGE